MKTEDVKNIKIDNLSKSAMETLINIEAGRDYNVKFQMGESLRKRGLVNRFTTYVSHAVFYTPESPTGHDQGYKNIQRHEWTLTSVGAKALDQLNAANSVLY